MLSPIEVFGHSDDLASVPEPNRKNYLVELEWLVRELRQHASVLQVGSMKGQRVIRLLEARNDLQVVGLEIDQELIELARTSLSKAGFEARFVLGDITAPPELPRFDYVICLNNTLGYIGDDHAAIAQMRNAGKTVVVSVYGERFSNCLATSYYESLGLLVDNFDDEAFSIRGFGEVKRYTRKIVESWGGEIVETPIGYLTVLR